MFDKKKEPEPQRAPDAETWQDKPAATSSIRTHTTSVIGSSIKLKGDISGEENLIVEGHVEGFIRLPNHDLTIGKSGTAANLSAKTVKIDGTVEGNIDGTELVTVSNTGKVLGDIKAPRVNLEDGAKFKGSIDMDPGEGPAGATKPAKFESGDFQQEEEVKQATA